MTGDIFLEKFVLYTPKKMRHYPKEIVWKRTISYFFANFIRPT